MAKLRDSGLEEVWGIRPYNPELDTRPEGDRGRRKSERMYERRCLDQRCITHRVAPIAELAEDRMEAVGELPPTDRVRLFADAWRKLNEWRGAERPEDPGGSANLMGEWTDAESPDVVTELLEDLEVTGLLIPVLRGGAASPKTPGSSRAPTSERGR
jgi:hypothetical protein